MKLKKLLPIAFMISGMSALIYEVAWARPLQLIFGSAIYAVSTMLTTFFIGFALGSYAFRNFADKTKNSARIFALLEIGIGIYGFAIIWLFKILPAFCLYFEKLPGLQFMKFAVIFLTLIIPTTLFGATWPVISKAYASQDEIGKNIGKLYSFNSFGSFAGSIISGFILIPALGISATSMLVASINILVGILVLANKEKEGEKNGD